MTSGREASVPQEEDKLKIMQEISPQLFVLSIAIFAYFFYQNLPGICFFWTLLIWMFISIIFLPESRAWYAERIRNFQNHYPIWFGILAILSIFVFSCLFVISLNIVFNSFGSYQGKCLSQTLIGALITGQSSILIFTITMTFVIVQLNSNLFFPRITEMMKSFTDLTIVIIVYLISITYDITLLLFSNIPLESSILGNVAFILALTSFLSLIPYRRNVLVFMRPENLMGLIIQEIEKNEDDKWLCRNHVISIFDIIIGSLQRGDLETVEVGMNRINDLQKKSLFILKDYRIQEIFNRSFDQILSIAKSNGHLYIIDRIQFIRGNYSDFVMTNIEKRRLFDKKWNLR